MVLGERHHRLLPTHEHGQRRRREGERLEPALPFSRHGPLQRRQRRPRHVRHAFCRSELGGEEHAAGFDHGNRPRIPRPKPPVVSIPCTRAIQRRRRSRERKQLQLPSVAALKTTGAAVINSFRVNPDGRQLLIRIGEEAMSRGDSSCSEILIRSMTTRARQTLRIPESPYRELSAGCRGPGSSAQSTYLPVEPSTSGQCFGAQRTAAPNNRHSSRVMAAL